MSDVLVKFRDNWADEFDINGFKIMPKKEWEDYKNNVQAIEHWPQSMYFGTNEGVEYESAEDYLRCFSVLDISNTEKVFLEKTFSSREYGHFLEFEEKWEYYTSPRPLW